MNICIVEDNKLLAHAGGVESVCYNYACLLAEHPSHQVYQLYRLGNSPDISGVLYQRLPDDLTEKNTEGLNSIRSYLVDNKIDIIWSHSSNKALNRFIFKSTQGTHIRIISVLHTTPSDIIKELRDRHDLALYRMIQKKEVTSYIKTILRLPFAFVNAYRKCYISLRNRFFNCHRLSLLSSHYIQEFFQLTLLKHTDKVTYIANPLLPPSIQPDIREKKNIVLVVARHVWKHKRLDRIINIWSQVEGSFPDWELVVLGDGPAHTDYVHDAQRLGIKNICFPGQQSPDAYYQQAKITCMTSGWEGLPMALLEAQQYGCVPICYESFAALPDIIEDGKTGYRIRPFNKKDFIKKLRHMMSTPTELEQMAKNCIKHSENFAIDRVFSQWLRLFEEVINDQKQH